MSDVSSVPLHDHRLSAGLRRSAGRRLVQRLRTCVTGCTTFCALAWPGAAAGLALAALFFPVYGGFCIGTGLGTFIDVLGCLVLGAIVLTLTTLLLLLVLALTRRMPLRFKALALVAFISLLATGMLFDFDPPLALRLGGPPILLLTLAGAGVAVLLRRGRAGRAHIVVASLMLLATVVSTGGLIGWLSSPGQDPFLQSTPAAADGNVPPLDAPDPAQAGTYEVGTLFYGSGADRQRPEYGAGVDLKTDPVDGSAFLADLKGFKAWARRRYWGFGPENLPLNARVWFPKGDGPFPLVLIVHGNHKMEEFSDPGYGYLGELLASRGFITASVDENFLNSSWSGDIGGTNLRGWLLLKHLELWQQWNEEEGNPFHNKVDMLNIALIGHSRGGEAITHAAAFNKLKYYPDDARVAFDFGFFIRTLIAIAPIDGQYEPAGMLAPIENVNYLVLQGSHDGDLSFFAGARTYRRVRFTDGNPWMKAALYIYRANHGQFNTVWGKYDAGPPLQYFVNRRPLLSGAEQRAIAKTYISAFLEATLHGRQQYVPMFRDERRAARWLPDTIYFSRFESSHFRAVSDFDEAIDITKTTVADGTQRGENLDVWRQQEMTGRGDWSFADYAAVLGWNTDGQAQADDSNAPGYAISLPYDLPRHWLIDKHTLLSFCLADTGERCEPSNCPPSAPAAEPPADGAANEQTAATAAEEDPDAPIDLTVELAALDGSTARLPLSHVAPLPRALRVTFTKWPYWERTRYKSPTEPVLQTYAIPLGDFLEANPEFDFGILEQIRFRFDRTRSAVILLDNVGFDIGPSGAAPATP
jgi:hypothetical protein